MNLSLDKNMILGKSNRIKTQQAKPHKFWCINCDAALVGEYSKCPNCGKRTNNKKFKSKRGKESLSIRELYEIHGIDLSKVKSLTDEQMEIETGGHNG